jgi:serine/threonine-protein kinase
MQPEFLDNDYVQIMFAQDGVQFLLYPPAFGYAMACDQAVVKVPYADVKPLMDPRAVALIPGG